MFTRKSILHVFSILLAVMILPAPTHVRAASLTVDSLADTIAVDSHCTLREAIQNANNNAATNSDCAVGSGADTIMFSVSGAITLGLILPYIADTAGLTIDGIGQTITINGNNATQIAAIQPSASLTLKNLTITNGYTYSFGGGITNGGTLVIENSVFSTNNAGYGGGGIYSRGAVTVTDSIISDNSANMGGGIYNDGGTLVVTNSVFSGNIATKDEGGGIYVFSGTLSITDSTFSNNISSLSSGGAIQNDVGTLNITNSTFSNNNATMGGGIFNRYRLTITNTTFSANNAGAGGGIYNKDSPASLTMTNGTFSGNSDGIYNSGSAILKNTIIANSASGGNCDGTITADSHNLATDSTCGNATQKTSTEINLGPLADNDGSTQSMALLPGSAAIDTGDNMVCPTTDQRGVSRPQGAACDIGAYELIIAAPIFSDVPSSHWAYGYIERLYNAGITGGCLTNPLSYCPDSTVTRAQMAVFLLKGMHGSGFTPPVVGASTGFTDVATDYWAAAWIKQLAAEGITGGCGAGIYCPDSTVTRAQMAVFLLKAKHGTAYTPPAATGVFTDVPVGYWADKWIEQLAAEAITGGCDVGIYCPDTEVTRAQMAVFLVKAFNLP